MKEFFRHIRHDAPASVVVFFVAVPLCLGIALASGAPLFSGLIAGIVGGIVVGSLSGSPLGVSGPAAGLAVIVFGAVETLGFPAFLVAVVLGGAMQIALGALRAGVIAYFFPSSVIKGMLAGIGVIIVLKQIPHAFGHDSDPEGDFGFVQPDGQTTLSTLSATFGDFEPSAILVSITALLILLLWETDWTRRTPVLKTLPGPLVAVAFGICFQSLASIFAPQFALESSHLVAVPVATGWSDLSGLLVFPDWTQLSNPAIYITAATIAIVASLETLLCVDATDKLDKQRRITPANRELVAQGCGNMLSGLIGGLPITQVIVRSSANIQSGGRTKLSAILHGVLLLIAVVALPKILNLVPLAVLASILFVVGYKLAKPALFKTMYEQGFDQFAPFIVTILGIVLTDLLTGIALGMAVAVFLILYRNYMNSHFLHLSESQSEVGQRILSMHLVEEVTFMNKGAIIRSLAAVPDGTHVRIDSSRSFHVDHDVLEAIAEFEESAPTRNITVERIERTSSANEDPNADNYGVENADTERILLGGDDPATGATAPTRGQ
ncbi:MAG: SulP family inorganic anion transporter [Candidatus Binatia bacterium]|nr:SulP family inorganic anion transporter [Candidatus Binatia bacterium]